MANLAMFYETDPEELAMLAEYPDTNSESLLIAAYHPATNAAALALVFNHPNATIEVKKAVINNPNVHRYFLNAICGNLGTEPELLALLAGIATVGEKALTVLLGNPNLQDRDLLTLRENPKFVFCCAHSMRSSMNILAKFRALSLLIFSPALAPRDGSCMEKFRRLKVEVMEPELVSADGSVDSTLVRTQLQKELVIDMRKFLEKICLLFVVSTRFRRCFWDWGLAGTMLATICHPFTQEVMTDPAPLTFSTALAEPTFEDPALLQFTLQQRQGF